MRHRLHNAALIILTTSVALATVFCFVMATRSTSAHATSPVSPNSQIATITHTGDIQVTQTLANNLTAPQVVLTTPAATYDGGAVSVQLDIEYVNMIPDPTQYSNGIGFELYEDGTAAADHVERLTLFGGHSFDNGPMFGPIFTNTILDGSLAPTAGTHTFYLAVWKWDASPADGYLRAGDNSEGGTAQPMRLTVSYV